MYLAARGLVWMGTIWDQTFEAQAQWATLHFVLLSLMLLKVFKRHLVQINLKGVYVDRKLFGLTLCSGNTRRLFYEDKNVDLCSLNQPQELQSPLSYSISVSQISTASDNWGNFAMLTVEETLTDYWQTRGKIMIWVVMQTMCHNTALRRLKKADHEGPLWQSSNVHKCTYFIYLWPSTGQCLVSIWPLSSQKLCGNPKGDIMMAWQSS